MTAPTETTDKKSLAAALGKVASGIFIVTARSGHHRNGFLASWVQQTSFEPPLLTVAVKKGRSIETLFEKECPFVIHVLGKENKNLMKHFLKGFGPDEDAFEGLHVFKESAGVPILTDALAYLECRYIDHLPTGDHVLYVGEVLAGEILNKNDEPMTHVRKNGLNY